MTVAAEYVFDDSSTGLGRLDEKRFFDNLTQYDDGNGTPAETVEYTYDDLGRVLSIVDDRGTTSYTYNNDGLTTKIDSPEGIIRYEYEPLTNRLTRTYTTDGAGEVLNDFEYTYDSLGRLKTVTVVERNDEELATPETTAYSYDLVGNLDRVDQPNGIVTEYEYDDLNRLDKLTHYEPDATPQDLSDNDKITEFDYDVRADGKRTGVTETYYDSGSPETIEIDWTYDNLGRLVDEVFNHYDDMLDQTLEFSYDLVGNRLEQTKDSDNDGNVDETITYTYDDNDRLLTESKDSDNDGNVDQTTTYSYTATEQTGKTVVDESTGNTLSQTDFTYNLQGRLESATIKTYDSSENLIREEVTTYDYDDSGYRVTALHEIDSDGDGDFDTRTLTEYLADPNNHTGYTQTIEETVTDADTSAEIKKVVYTIGHDVIAQTTFTPSGPDEGETIVLLYDGHGSTRLVSNLAAQILEAYAYDAYGNAIGFDPGAALTSLLYSGESFDSRISQQYLRARWYDATTGRFNRLDPFAGNLRDPQSLHKYLYTHGDPVTYIDPSGESPLTSMIAAIGTIAILGFAVSASIDHPEVQVWEEFIPFWASGRIFGHGLVHKDYGAMFFAVALLAVDLWALYDFGGFMGSLRNGIRYLNRRGASAIIHGIDDAHRVIPTRAVIRFLDEPVVSVTDNCVDCTIRSLENMFAVLQKSVNTGSTEYSSLLSKINRPGPKVVFQDFFLLVERSAAESGLTWQRTTFEEAASRNKPFLTIIGTTKPDHFHSIVVEEIYSDGVRQIAKVIDFEHSRKYEIDATWLATQAEFYDAVVGASSIVFH